MHAGFVNGVECREAGNRGGHHRLGHLVDEISEQGVFLRGAPDNREGVDRVLLAENFFHL